MRKNYKLGAKLGVAAFLMFGFAYLLVPLYEVFCEITGLNGRTLTVAKSPTQDMVNMERSVTIQFLSHAHEPHKWRFSSEKVSMKVHPGMVYTTYYKAKNLANENATIRAVPSTAPGLASRYLEKIECFCFKEQSFTALEERDMPVSFKVNPRLPKRIKTISLSYAFFDVLIEEPGNPDEG